MSFSLCLDCDDENYSDSSGSGHPVFENADGPTCLFSEGRTGIGVFRPGHTRVVLLTDIFLFTI